MSSIIRLPLCAVVSVGLKVTDTLQLAPGLSVFSHSDLIENTGGDAVSIVMFTGSPVFLLPAFLIVTVLDLLAFPTVVLLPNAKVLGVTVSFSGSGVGVAVGPPIWVGVAVGVTVGVPPVGV